MDITAAIAQLRKEQESFGWDLLELLADIQKDDGSVYSEKTMRAYRVFMAQGARMFAPVAE